MERALTMDTTRGGDVEDDRHRSPYVVLQQISEEAVRVASEAIQNAVPRGGGVGVGEGIGVGLVGGDGEGGGIGEGGGGGGRGGIGGGGHRRAKSEMAPLTHQKSSNTNNNFQKWKAQVHKAMQWGADGPQHEWRYTFNPEVLANQKRQWYKIHSSKAPATVLEEDEFFSSEGYLLASQTGYSCALALRGLEAARYNRVSGLCYSKDLTKYKAPMLLFEHFVIVGLHSDSNLEAVEDAFAKRKMWELHRTKSEIFDLKKRQYNGPSLPTLEPQILFKYPPAQKLAIRPQDLPAFCFPEGIKARLVEKSPSLSDLNEVVYGQEHLGRDDLSFIFSLKGSDNTTLYGVCVHVPEIVQRSPGIVGLASPLSQSSGSLSRFLVSAPRCYCVLTRVPFFELHFEMLNSIVKQERLDRITQFVSEMTLTDYVPSPSRTPDRTNGNIDSPNTKCSADWMATAIPLDSAAALTAAAAGIVTDNDVQSSSFRCESQSPNSVCGSEASDCSRGKEIDKEKKRGQQCDCASEAFETLSDVSERENGCDGNGHTSPDIGMICSSKSCRFERLESSNSLFSSVRSMASEDEDEANGYTYDKNADGDVVMNWAKEHQNHLLQIVCGYHALSVPSYGSELVFHPLEHLQAIKYGRPAVSALGLGGYLHGSLEGAEVNARLAAAEEAHSLSIWTIATICRALSLESILAYFAGVLLEKQIIVVCQNMGVLSATILALVPMIRPFEWQSLMLPVLPRKMFDFLDAPVPYIVGIQHKPADLRIRTANLINVDVNKDKVKMCYLPSLPRHKELFAELAPIHARLAGQSNIAKKHPVHKCNEVQAEAAGQFLDVMRRYLESLCTDLRSHTITSVQSNIDKVSLLFKDSFIDSFPTRDRPFIKLFVDTQLFSVLSDYRLSCFEHE